MPRKKDNYFACPIDYVLGLLGDKWTLDILRDLLNSKKRTSELLRSLSGISPRTLAQRLRELESHQLIIRTVYPEVPPKVEYSLTETGYKVRSLMQELSRLGETLQDAKKVWTKANESQNCPHCSRANNSSEPCFALEQSLVVKKKETIKVKQINKLLILQLNN